MKKFDHKIDGSIQGKVRKVNNLPLDDSSMALAWFSSKQVTPSNNISITDLSNFTPENSYSSDIGASNNRAKNKLVFANELGMLEDSDGNTVFDSDDISVSDIFLSDQAFDKRYHINDIKKNNFIHSYYISRYYTLLPRNSYGFNSLDDFVEMSKIPFSIKVLDQNGYDYLDPNTGDKKYRILIEQMPLSLYSDRTAVPSKVVVLFDSPNPVDLRLVYDKVSLSSTSSISSVVPQYRENINTVSLFSRVAEESFVVDNSSRKKKIFARKSLSSKNNMIASTNTNADGFEIFVPKKGLSDSRTYESFNWRLIAKIKKSVDVSSVNNGEELDSESNIKQKVVNCAVLSSASAFPIMEAGRDYSSANPYVFYRLEQSPFNLSGYLFQNPKMIGTPKQNALYWLLNIDEVSATDLDQYDVLAWSPTATLTTEQGAKIKRYTEISQGTLILDLSRIPSGAESIDPSLSVSSLEYALDSWTYNPTNIFIDENKHNAWKIDETVFETLTVDGVNHRVYSIFGRSNLSDISTKKICKEFTGSLSPSNIVLKNSRGNPIFVSLEFAPYTDALAKGSILASTAQFLKYCNDLYQPSSFFDISTANSGVASIEENPFNVVAAIEGPFKLLYNAVSVALLARIFSTKTKDVRSSMYYHVSKWDSSFVINGNALLEDEKKEIYSPIKLNNIDSIGTVKYCKSLIPKNNSIIDYYRSSVYDYLPDQYSLSTQEIDLSNITFYVEITNPDAIIANAVRVEKDYTSEDVEEIPTSYTLYKLDADTIDSTLYAYTNSPSPQFVIPGGFGPYVIRDRMYKSSDKEVNDFLNKSISTINTYKAYPFNFSIFNSYVSSKESSNSFSASWTANVEARYSATLSREAFYKEHVEATPDELVPVIDPPHTQIYEPTQNSNAVYSGADRRTNIVNSTDPANSYLYTGDIQAGNTTKQFVQGMLTPLNYINYIQISLREYGIVCPITGSGIGYNAATFNAVKAFQVQEDARFKNGTVDSETKSLLAIHVWKKIKSSDPVRYQAILARVAANKALPAGVVKFIIAAADAIELHELPSRDWNYRKVTFTGLTGPSTLIDTIWVAAPSDQLGVATNVKVLDLSITTGAFAGATSYKGISIKEIKCYPAGSSTGTVVQGILNYTTGVIKVVVDKPIAECAVFSIRFSGALLGGSFGSYTEGYSIQRIAFNMGYNAIRQKLTLGSSAYDIFGYKPETQTKDVIIKYVIQGKVENISPNKGEIIDISGIKSVKFATTPISMLYPTWSGEMSLDLTATKIDFSDIKYSPAFTPFIGGNVATISQSGVANSSPQFKDESITIDLTSSREIDLLEASLLVSDVFGSTNNPVSSSSISVSAINNIITFETSTEIYENSKVLKSTEKLLDTFWLLKADGSVIKQSKNTVTVLDGLTLLCQPSSDPSKIGKPYGIEIKNFAMSLLDTEEFNVDYGSIILINNVPDNGGFVYGFYDKNKKEFLGTNLYYIDYISRGPDNIYIGVLAIDADGNTSSNIDFFGPKTSSRFIPSNVPVKIACPIYNLEYNSSSRIGLSSIPPNLKKTQQWPLYFTAGSFTKDIYINPVYGWTSWLSKYVGKTLRATYSTLDIDSAIWSQIAGRPYIDVLDEVPTVLSNRRVQLSQTPIATFREPSNTVVGVIKNWVSFEKRDNINSKWELVESNLIRNINCNTGIVDFVTPLSDDPNLIRVSYTAKATGIPIKQVSGAPIPINPFLNRDLVDTEKALHIYINPSRIEVRSSENNAYTWDYVSEHPYGPVIDFTYDTNIFDYYNSTEYDPFAMQIALIHVLNSVDIKDVRLEDLRLKGGGLKATLGKTINVKSYGALDLDKVLVDIPEAISFWDIYPSDQESYPKGGYVIIQIPRSVLENFNNEEEIYSIIDKNITAGVAYKIQDMDGKDWARIR